MAQSTGTVTPRQEIENRLKRKSKSLGDKDLDALVHYHRVHGRSWRWIATEISRVVNYDISNESLRRWFPAYNKPVHELVDSS